MKQYIYPDNLTAKATLWLWKLKDLSIIGMLAIAGTYLLTETGVYWLLIIAAIYAFLTIQFSGTSILDFLRYASAYFFTPQSYLWGPGIHKKGTKRK